MLFAMAFIDLCVINEFSYVFCLTLGECHGLLKYRISEFQCLLSNQVSRVLPSPSSPIRASHLWSIRWKSQGEGAVNWYSQVVRRAWVLHGRPGLILVQHLGLCPPRHSVVRDLAIDGCVGQSRSRCRTDSGGEGGRTFETCLARRHRSFEGR